MHSMNLLNTKASTTTLGSVALLVILAISSTWLFSDEKQPVVGAAFSPLARVTEGPFEVYVNAPAILSASQSVTLSSELPSNRAKILYLAKEGDLLNAGDVVARFDAATFEDDVLRLQGEIKEVNASLMQARAEEKLQAQEALQRKAETDYQVVMAGLKKSRLERVDIPSRRQVANKELNSAKAEHKRASKERDTQQQLVTQGLARKSELQKAVDEAQQAQALLAIAQQNVDTLEQVAFPSELQQASMELENRQREQASFDEGQEQRVIKQQAVIKRLETKLASLQQSLAKTHRYLALTTLKAPVRGIILYKRVSQGTEKRKPQVGDSLWNRHAFAVIPDMSSLVAVAQVSEQDVGKLEIGQRTRISPAAYAGLTLEGTVASIGTLADDENTDTLQRHFQVRIALNTIDPRLRPGMSARASILSQAFSDVAKVPVEAIFYHGDSPVGFLVENGEHKRVPLELGVSDSNFIVVNSGLVAGQQVSLVYPRQFSDQ